MRKLAVLAAALAFVAGVAAVAASRGTGTLKLAQGGVAVELTFANKQKLLVMAKGTSVPEGTYAPESYAVLKPAKDGTVWKLLNYRGNLGPLKSITVAAGETTEIDVGAPLKVVPTRGKSTESSSGRLSIPIGYSIRGKGGEAYSLQLWKGNCTARHAHFQILDLNDKLLEEGRLPISAAVG